MTILDSTVKRLGTRDKSFVSRVLLSAAVGGQCSDSSSVSSQFQYLANGTCLPCPSGCSSCLAVADDVLYPCTACDAGFYYAANPRSALTAGGRCVAGCDDLGLLVTTRDSSRLRLTTSRTPTAPHRKWKRFG